MDNKKDVLKPHTYDGIQEYDNQLPRWWLMSFYLSIIWGVGYILHYHVLELSPLGAEAVEQEIRVARELRLKNSKGVPEEGILREMSADPTRIAAGKEVYKKLNCQQCHGPDGYGGIGPNLRDDFWLHGSDMTHIVDTITNGRKDGAMPAQKTNASANDIYSLSCYIADLNRKTPKTDGRSKAGQNPMGELNPISY